MGTEYRDQLVEHPTYLEHVRYFFDAIDVDHMRSVAGIDLSTYEGVKARATQIYFQTSSGQMPPEETRRWPEARVRTFRNWMVDKFPVGVLPLDLVDLSGTPADRVDIRRNAANLNADEIDKLRLAFRTIMDRDPDHPQSYFALAGIHWLPEPTYCLHHEPRYHSWHRVYIDRFEAALRSVPGCEDIRLPYWDILQPIPGWLFEPPFDSYELPRDVDERYKAGFRVARFEPAAIYDGIARYEVSEDIAEALNAANFEAFALAIERAHDDGHVSIGPQAGMGRPDLASFDPIFWFFHCNWERMWWSWQKRYSADTLDRFRSTLADQSWLDDPLFNGLDPFGVTTLQTIDASGYAYEEIPAVFRAHAGFVSGNVPIERAFRISPQRKVSIRVKNIERLRISGSFVVHLVADQTSVAQRAFFQSSEPTKCPNCVERARVNIDFIVNRDSVDGKRLTVRFETLAPDRVDRWIPLSQVGSPTINIRELLISD